MTQLHDLTAVELRALRLAGDVSSSELTRHYLDRIHNDPHQLNAFATVTDDLALDRAASIDALDADRLATTPLAGLPTADKDLWQRRGVVTRWGSRMSSPDPATETDVLPQRLDAAGAVSLGKTTTPEFGLNAYTENALTGATRNPWDLHRDPGGSSGGAATAVAARQLPLAPGNDGGGSIRIPAAVTGVVGLKTTRGRIPQGIERPGRLVTPGPLARTTADAALLFAALVAPTDPPDALLAAVARPPRPVVVGVLDESPWQSAYPFTVDAEVLTARDAMIGTLESLGHRVRPVGMPASASEYPDAFMSAWAGNMRELPADGHEELLEPLTRWIWERGRAATDEASAAALAVLQRFSVDVDHAFAGVDVVLTPTVATTATVLGWFSDDPATNFAQQCAFTPWTSFVNVTGRPAISVPAALSSPSDSAPAGLPIGMQFIGARGDDELLLSLSAQLEDALDWAARIPPFAG